MGNRKGRRGTLGKLLFSVSETMQATGLSRRGLYRALKLDLPSIKFGKRRFFRPSDIDAWIAKQVVGVAPMETASANDAAARP